MPAYRPLSLVDLLERVALRFEREESPQQKLSKLEGFLVQYGLPLAEVVPLFAALLSSRCPSSMPPCLRRRATEAADPPGPADDPPTYCCPAASPLCDGRSHWVDPSTLELLSLLVDQGPTAHILTLLTFRPDFSPPWTGRAHLTQVTVNQLPRHQAVGGDSPGGSRQGLAPGGGRRSWPRPMGCRCS